MSRSETRSDARMDEFDGRLRTVEQSLSAVSAKLDLLTTHWCGPGGSIDADGFLRRRPLLGLSGRGTFPGAGHPT